MLVAYIRPVCALLAPCRAGASTPRLGTLIPFRVLTAMANRRSTNDLFEIFPDLPGNRHRSAAEQIEAAHVRWKTRGRRANENILRQKAAAERVRAAISRTRRE